MRAQKMLLSGILVITILASYSLSPVSYAKPIKIGFILKTMQEERYKKDKQVFTETVEKLGGTVLFDSCNNDEQMQISKVETMLSKKIDVLVIQPVNSNTAGTLVDNAYQKRTRVISYDMIIANTKHLSYFLTQDSFAVGYLQAEEAIKKGYTGNWILLRGQPNDSNAEAFSQGVIETAQKNNITIIVDKSHIGWSPELAQATVEDAIAKYGIDKISAIIANNSGLAWGALQALESKKVPAGKIFIAGSDADLRNCQAIFQGRIAADIYKAIQPLAAAAAQTAMLLAENKSIDEKSLDSCRDSLMDTFNKTFKLTTMNNGSIDIPAIITPVYLVTKETMNDTVVAGGFHREEAVKQ